VEALVTAGARVRVLDNFSSGRETNLAAVASDIELVTGDILDLDTVVNASSGCDLISHQAAQLEITKCIEDPIGDLRSNTEGSLNILEAARYQRIRRVVYASSACVYGQAETLPEAETHPVSPNWPYGISKLAAEHYARLYYELHGIDTVGLRYSIVYGPREWYGRALTLFCRRALAGQAPVVFGAGSQLRDLVYVDDVVAANISALDVALPAAPVLNISTGVGTTIREMAEMVCELVNAPAGGRLSPVFDDVAPGEVSILADGRQRLPGELQAMVLDPRAAQSALGWRADVMAREGIERELDWVRANPGCWTEMHY
jgi:UDP-glucose 4-epimerase